MAGYPTLLLHRTTNFSVPASTDTAVPWSSAIRNTGPSGWWNANTPTLIHMPYVGKYLMVCQLSWEADGTPSGMRNMHYNNSATIGSGNFDYSIGFHPTTTDEESAYLQQTFIMEIATAQPGQIVMWNSGGAAFNLTNRLGAIPPASLALTYLGA